MWNALTRHLGSLRGKMLVLSVAVEIVMLALLIANGLRLMHDHMVHSLQVRANELQAAFGVAVVSSMATRNYPELQSIVDGWAMVEDLAYISITDRSGRIVALAGWPTGQALPRPDHQISIDDSVYDVAADIAYAGQIMGQLHFGLSTNLMGAVKSQMLGQGALIAAGEVLLSILLLSVLGYWLTRHLRQLADASQAVAAGETVRVPVSGKDEVGELAVSFNQMAQAVETRLQELEESRRHFRTIADYTYAWENWFDARGNLLWVSPAVERMTGYSPDECHSMTAFPLPIIHPDDQDDVQTHLRTARVGQPGQDVEFRVLHKDQRILWMSMCWQPIQEDDGTISGFRSSLRDVTSRRSAIEQLAFQASHDSLTGLYNRQHFESRLAVVVENRRGGGGCGNAILLYVDLDQFKVINDTCGHMAGDHLLTRLAHMMQILAGDGLVARLGGDEFGILFTGISLSEATHRAQRLINDIQRMNFTWNGATFRVGASIGIVQLGNGIETVQDLLIAADTACFTAKERGRNRTQLYSLDDAFLSKRRDEVLSIAEMARALDENRLKLYYQRIAALNSRHVDHAEVLLRFQTQDGRLLSPANFIPAAERYGLMTHIDRWVIENTFRTIRQSLDGGQEIPWGRTSINLSGLSLSDGDLVDFISDRMDRFSLDPRMFCFEVTETAAISSMDHAVRIMERLRQFGCKLALDDFGAGLSSFAYLKQIAVDYLKIDGMFVKNLEDDLIDRAVVESIIHVAKVHKLSTVAEYVRSPAICTIVEKVGADLAQGYAVHSPQPLDQTLRAA